MTHQLMTMRQLVKLNTFSRYLEVQCFSLRTKSWSCIELIVQYYRGNGWRNRFLFNGALHWFVESINNIGIIIAFDVMERKLSEISVPHDVAVG